MEQISLISDITVCGRSRPGNEGKLALFEGWLAQRYPLATPIVVCHSVADSDGGACVSMLTHDGRQGRCLAEHQELLEREQNLVVEAWRRYVGGA